MSSLPFHILGNENPMRSASFLPKQTLICSMTTGSTSGLDAEDGEGVT